MFRTRGPNDLIRDYLNISNWAYKEKKAVKVKCTDSGFQIDFPNGWTASVQWGACTYSDNYDARLHDGTYESTTAEIWALETEGKGRYPRDPKGRQTMNQVRNFLEEVSVIGEPSLLLSLVMCNSLLEGK